MFNQRFQNQRLLINEDKLRRARFVVVGAGAIASNFVVALSKMGARNIVVYDFDTLEDHNFATQLHPISQLGKPKVQALRATAKDFGGATISAVEGPWTPEATLATIKPRAEGGLLCIVSCVDNMDVRASLWNFYKDRASFFLDGRMSAFVYKVYGIDLRDDKARKLYEGSLHSQADASPERCGEKSIIYTVLAVSSQMCSQVKEYIMGDYRPSYLLADLYNHTLTPEFTTERPLPEVFTAEEGQDTVEEVKEQEGPLAA